jgi:hypothetical protein
MTTRVPAAGSLPGTHVPPPWSGLEPEDLEDAARSLCARCPGSSAAERLMERAAYLRANRSSPTNDPRVSGALLLS